MGNFGLAQDRMSGASARFSDIRLGALPEEDDTTFAFTVPQRGIPDEYQPENVPDDEAEEAEEVEDVLSEGEEEQYEDVDDDVEMAEADPADPSRFDISVGNTGFSHLNTANKPNPKPRIAKKKKIKVSKHGIPYPSLPAGVVKKLATRYARTSGNGKAKIGKDTMDAIMQASDWFFEQVSEDLGAYCDHAGRKTIEEKDVVTLMARYVFLHIVQF